MKNNYLKINKRKKIRAIFFKFIKKYFIGQDMHKKYAFIFNLLSKKI